METSPPPHQQVEIPTRLYYQLVFTLNDLLPPPIVDTPAALRMRNHAAIAKVAALLPVDSNEIDLAAQCIAARAQAEDVLRSIRQHAGDIALVMRLNAQYTSMVRTSLSVHGRLMRVQALRHKREAIEGKASEDACTRHVTQHAMANVINPAASPQAAPVPAPAAEAAQPPAETVSETEPKSHDVAFETPTRAHPLNPGSAPLLDTAVLQRVREALAASRSPGWQVPPILRKTPQMAASPGLHGAQNGP